MKKEFFSSKIFFIFLVLVLLIIFNVTRRPPESETSKEFQSIVGRYQEQSKLALKEGRQVQRVAISVKNSVDPSALNYSVDNTLKTDDPVTTDTMIHLLDLLYESGVVSTRGPQSGTFQVKVEVNNELFDGSFEEKDIARKTPLATFLKLMQLHGRMQALAQRQ